MGSRLTRVSNNLLARRGSRAASRALRAAVAAHSTGSTGSTSSPRASSPHAPFELLEPRLCLSAATAPSFQPVANIPVGGVPTAVVTDDFNDDGNDDVAVALGQSNAVGVALGNGDGTFGAFTDYGTGTDPTAIATGDFDNDGNDDIVTADAGSGDISVLLCNADSNDDALGTFAAPINKHVEAPGNGPMSLAVGDFDDDGNLDVAVAGPSGLYVLLGNGDGTFSSPNLIASGDFSGVVADNFYPAGNTDLAAVDPATGVVDVFQGNGDGTFAAPATYNVGIGASSIASGDFNNDGVEDIAVSVPGQNAVEVLLGNTTTVTVPITPTPITPTPITPTPITPTPITPTPVLPGPVLPISVPLVPTASTTNLTTVSSTPASGGTSGTGNSGSGDGDGSYSYTTGSGTFAAPVTVHLDQSPASLTLDDLADTGNLDIVTVNTANNSVTVIPGNGDGTFGTPVDLATGSAPAGVTTDDVNDDGGDDILTANASGVSVLLQQAPDVGVTLTASSPTATINTNLTYTAVVTNNGPGTATGVTLDDSLPANVTLVSATSTQGSVDTSSTTDVDVSFGDLASGASATVTIIVQPTQYGISSNSVSISSDSNDPNYSNNDASTDTPVVGATGAEVALTSNSRGAFLPPVPVLPIANGAGSVTPVATATLATPINYGGYFAEVGQDYTYSFTVTNYGPDSAVGLNFTDTLPAGVTFESATSSAGTTDSATPGTVTVALGDLAAGGSATISITIKPTVAGSITDTASVAAADPSTDPYPQDNITTVDTYVEGKGGLVPYPVLESAPVATTLSGVASSGATVGKPVTNVTAGVPTLSIGNVKHVGTTQGTTDFLFTVTRSGNLTSASTVNYSTSSGTAKAGTNFTPASGQLSFAAGVSTATVTVPVLGSKKYKPASTFVVALAHPTNAAVKTPHGVGTILSAVKAPKPKPTPNPAAKGIHINFEPAGGPAVKGYLEDTGLVYGPQGTLTYGWSTDNTDNAVDRDAVKDARYDTFNVLGAPGAANWQIALPDGRYRLSLHAGDPNNTTNSNEIDANGSLVLHGKAKKKHPFVSGSAVVSVNDGLLTLTPGSAASPDDLDFLQIKYVGDLKT
jgi:uncharacterized repeat protein (TIGR01451 family)